MSNKGILWFRNDLRLDDNQSLHEALSYGDVIPVFVFDDRTFLGTTRRFGFKKTAAHRAKFILEAVADLKSQLQNLGSDLIVRSGLSEDVITTLAKELNTKWVFCNRERTEEEVLIQDQLESNLWSLGQELRYSRGKMLYHTADLPFPVSHTPDIFTQFRKEVERFIPIRKPLDPPVKMPAVPKALMRGKMPTLQDLGYQEIENQKPKTFAFKGGETEGLSRLKYYLWDSDLAKTYKKTRNELLGGDYSTKFSPYLALGCLSPKRILFELKKYEEERGSNDSTYWIFFELLWRDFFRLVAKKYQNSIFLENGIKAGKTPDWTNDKEKFERWAQGQTGIPFIDANMLELNATGFMSNRGRQNVASFLVKDLNVNWQMGAEYFESQLIDYDVASNWCNWNYVAGIGSDPREDRYFNILTQAQRYDPQGDFVKHWIPALKKLDAEKVHAPDLLSEKELAEAKIISGIDYPKSIISSEKWLKGHKSNKSCRVPRKKRGGRRRGSPQLDY